MSLSTGTLRIEGYAVVSDDDRIADADGDMPDSLKNDAEWEFFQAGLSAADVSVLGRRSHDATPNHAKRKRLILTRSVRDVVRDGLIVFWNPQSCGISSALDAFDMPVSHLAVAGGRDIFDFFLTAETPFTAFHLSRVRGVRLPGGTGVFSGVNRGQSAEAVLAEAGYQPGPLQVLDEGVDVVSWTPAT